LRFEELSCQLAGPTALRLNHYAARLKLSKDQRKRIRDLVDTYSEKAIPLQRACFGFRSEECDKQLNALAGELDDKILGILTAKQRAQWIGLLGKKFDWAGLAKG
jgi:hypothetical protein